jgi:hypothetical protein
MEEVEHRVCHNCGEAKVLSIEEARDVINDYDKLVVDYQELLNTLDDNEDSWWTEDIEELADPKNRQTEFYD